MTRKDDVIKVVPDGKVLDYIDDKPRNDTPEEYVRQNIEKRLILEHKYDRDQVRVEFPIKIGSSKKRREKRYSTEVVADRVLMLDRKQKTGGDAERLH